MLENRLIGDETVGMRPGDIRRDAPPGEVVHLVIGVGLSWSVFRVLRCMLSLFFWYIPHSSLTSSVVA